jgi:hypothetical protein
MKMIVGLVIYQANNQLNKSSPLCIKVQANPRIIKTRNNTIKLVK